ncbi:iron reductase [Mycena capillaripes]|nr:iron reductase [Mycena capillaripes]
MDHSYAAANRLPPPPNPDKPLSIQRNTQYPIQVWYLLASFIALVSICHWTTLLVTRLRGLKASSPGSSALSRLPLTALHLFRTVAFRMTASFGGYTLNLTEFFVGAGYIVAILTWEFINTTDLEGNRFALRYYANRAGLIAAAQYPLLIGLGMKNNIISVLTGIGSDKLNLLHRVVARVLCVLLWIHAGGRLVQNGRAENMKDFGEAWFRWGFVSVTALTLLMFLSVRPLRKRGYETFRVGHIVFALLFMIGTYIHTKKQKQSHYIWPAFVLWGFDLLLRYLRIFVINGGYLNFRGKQAAEANVDVVSPHLLRVTVYVPSRAWMSWKPGQMVHLSMPAVSRTPWEAHPFTVANIDSEEETNAKEKMEKSSRDTSETPSRDEKQDSVESSAKTLPTFPTTPGHRKLVFLVRVRGGFTKRLLDAAADNSKSDTFKAYIDGPYGSPPSMNGFGSVLLFAGGSGVSFTLPLLLDLIRVAKTKTNQGCGRVLFVWAVRTSDQINAISGTLSSALAGLDPTSLGIDIRIHVTTSVEDTDGDAASAEGDVEKTVGKARDTGLLVFPFVKILDGRPDVDQILRSEVEMATAAMSVNVCGPPALAQHVRKALRAATSASGPSVNLHVEAFGDA